jgi:hypothetical protein
MRALAAALLAGLITGCAAQSAALDQFRQTLASHDSATVALEQWCARRGIATPAQLVAMTEDDAERFPATPAIRRALGIGADVAVRVRHVRLACGQTVLSDARNWYVPGLLTPEMNRTLDTTRTPFGKAVAPLGLHRQPLPAGARRPAPCPAGTIHHESAVLRRNDGVAYSLVSECYTRANLAPPRVPHVDSGAVN